jgi:hypothetical protein
MERDPEEDDAAECPVCGEGFTPEGDSLQVCELCNASVHDLCMATHEQEHEDGNA